MGAHLAPSHERTGRCWGEPGHDGRSNSGNAVIPRCRQRRLQRQYVRVGVTRTDSRPCRRAGRRRVLQGQVAMAMHGGAVVVLRMVVIAVQVNVQQRRRPVADEQRDTGESSDQPLHVSRVYCILRQD